MWICPLWKRSVLECPSKGVNSCTKYLLFITKVKINILPCGDHRYSRYTLLEKWIYQNLLKSLTLNCKYSTPKRFADKFVVYMSQAVIYKDYRWGYGCFSLVSQQSYGRCHQWEVERHSTVSELNSHQRNGEHYLSLFCQIAKVIIIYLGKLTYIKIFL